MHGRLIRRVALGILILGVCVVLTDVLGFTWDIRARVRLREAERIADQLPVIPDAVLLQSKESEVRSNIGKCGVVEVDKLYGASALSLQDILDEFTSAIGGGEWTMDYATDRFRSFRAADETIVTISGNYEDPDFDKAVIMEGQHKYPTLFHILINRMVYPNARKECG